ncbi:MAG: dTDP-4-dehydrorhamnose 3,5-epimerase family protein [archaeon]|nr:dTDP-4-dehydrorhamnose 3,5-epimerase family protein [archaeon]
MKIQSRKLNGFFEISPDRHRDNRGSLMRLYDEETFANFGLNTNWVQESHSNTTRKNTLRGLHIQLPPYSETKLIRITRGESLWVAVDLRKDSETFGQWDSTILSRRKDNMAYVSKGFANGCLSLTNNCDLVIMSDKYFNNNGSGIIWDDSDLNIKWPTQNPIISDRDKNYSSFKEFIERYGGV